MYISKVILGGYVQKIKNIKQKTIALLVGGFTLLASPFASLAQVYANKYETTTVTYPYYGFIEDPNNPWATVYDALDETGTVEYSDEFFNEPSAGDHPELRTASYALALAGYENKDDGYPTSTDVSNPKLTGFLEQMGFSDFAYWDLESEDDGRSMGTTIARKTLPSGQDLIVVAPRNYNYMTEWISNLNVGVTGDHAGFSEAANLIVDRFNTYTADRNLDDYKTWMVGYSRGGAVVDLVGKIINTNINSYGMQPEDFYVYTFGAPRASETATNFSNIHDVKDGNDLILGYVFPEVWGFYNTGVYEEIHPADLVIDTSVVDITKLADSSQAGELLSSNEGITREVGKMNGREFMDAWMDFVVDSGLTREYFDAEVKAPLTAFLKAYQLRKLDKQSELTDFIGDTHDGLAGRLAGNALADLMGCAPNCSSIKEALDVFPVYQNLVKILRGTAGESEIDEIVSKLTEYFDDYSDYTNIRITEGEFTMLKENLPKLAKALLPIIVADGKYTQETYGENASLYHTYTLAANLNNLVYGHIPESIMPILKSMIPEDEVIIPKAPDTGMVK